MSRARHSAPNPVAHPRRKISPFDRDIARLEVRLFAQLDVIRRRYVTDPALHARFHALRLKYDPSQPRMPGGQPDGGQWVGNTHRVTGSSKPKPAAKPKVTSTQKPWDEKPTPTASRADMMQGLARSSDLKPVSPSETAPAANAAITEGAVNQDGSAIQANFYQNGTGPFDSQFTVTNPDGSAFAFTNSGDLQTVSSATSGQVVSVSMLGPTGAIAVPLAQSPNGGMQPILAQYAPPVGPPQIVLPMMALMAAVTLYEYLSASPRVAAPSGDVSNGAPKSTGSAVVADPNAIPVLELNKTRDYSDSSTGVPTNVYVGAQSLAQVQSNCRAYSRIQSWTDEAVNAISPAGMTPQAYGIAVHSYVGSKVDMSGDPTLSKEYRLPTTPNSPSVALGSIRPDIVENVGNGTVCVYDIKTGDASLTTLRSNDFASRLFRDPAFKSSGRILVITVRPSR